MTEKISKLIEAVNEALVQQIRNNLTPDLLKPGYGRPDSPTAGHCYVATESLYHLLGGAAAGLKPVSLRMPDGDVHWWLVDQDGNIIDATHDQFNEPVPYERGRARGFLPGGPSARSQELMRRVKENTMAESLPIEAHLSALDHTPELYLEGPLPGEAWYRNWMGAFDRVVPSTTQYVYYNVVDTNIPKPVLARENIVGSILFTPDPPHSVYVEEIYIDPDYRSTGAFRMLIQPVLDTGLPLNASFENPRLQALFMKLRDRGTIPVSPRFEPRTQEDMISQPWLANTANIIEIPYSSPGRYFGDKIGFAFAWYNGDLYVTRGHHPDIVHDLKQNNRDLYNQIMDATWEGKALWGWYNSLSADAHPDNVKFWSANVREQGNQDEEEENTARAYITANLPEIQSLLDQQLPGRQPQSGYEQQRDAGTQPVEVMSDNPGLIQYWANGGGDEDLARARIAWAYQDGTLYVGQNHRDITHAFKSEGISYDTNTLFGWIDPVGDGKPWAAITDYGVQDENLLPEVTSFFEKYPPQAVLNYIRTGELTTPPHLEWLNNPDEVDGDEQWMHQSKIVTLPNDFKPHNDYDDGRRTFIYLVPSDTLYISTNNAYHTDIWDWLYKHKSEEYEQLWSDKFKDYFKQGAVALGLIERNYEDHALECRVYWAEGNEDLPQHILDELSNYMGEKVYARPWEYPVDWTKIDYDPHWDDDGVSTQQYPTDSHEGKWKLGVGSDVSPFLDYDEELSVPYALIDGQMYIAPGGYHDDLLRYLKNLGYKLADLKLGYWGWFKPESGGKFEHTDLEGFEDNNWHEFDLDEYLPHAIDIMPEHDSHLSRESAVVMIDPPDDGFGGFGQRGRYPGIYDHNTDTLYLGSNGSTHINTLKHSDLAQGIPIDGYGFMRQPKFRELGYGEFSPDLNHWGIVYGHIPEEIGNQGLSELVRGINAGKISWNERSSYKYITLKDGTTVTDRDDPVEAHRDLARRFGIKWKDVEDVGFVEDGKKTSLMDYMWSDTELGRDFYKKDFEAKIAGVQLVNTDSSNYGGDNGPDTFVYAYDPHTNMVLVNTTPGGTHRNLFRALKNNLHETLNYQASGMGLGWLYPKHNYYDQATFTGVQTPDEMLDSALHKLQAYLGADKPESSEDQQLGLLSKTALWRPFVMHVPSSRIEIGSPITYHKDLINRFNYDPFNNHDEFAGGMVEPTQGRVEPYYDYPASVQLTPELKQQVLDHALNQRLAITLPNITWVDTSESNPHGSGVPFIYTPDTDTLYIGTTSAFHRHMIKSDPSLTAIMSDPQGYNYDMNNNWLPGRINQYGQIGFYEPSNKANTRQNVNRVTQLVQEAWPYMEGREGLKEPFEEDNRKYEDGDYSTIRRVTKTAKIQFVDTSGQTHHGNGMAWLYNPHNDTLYCSTNEPYHVDLLRQAKLDDADYYDKDIIIGGRCEPYDMTDLEQGVEMYVYSSNSYNPRDVLRAQELVHEAMPRWVAMNKESKTADDDHSYDSFIYQDGKLYFGEWHREIWRENQLSYDMPFVAGYMVMMDGQRYAHFASGSFGGSDDRTLIDPALAALSQEFGSPVLDYKDRPPRELMSKMAGDYTDMSELNPLMDEIHDDAYPFVWINGKVWVGHSIHAGHHYLGKDDPEMWQELRDAQKNMMWHDERAGKQIYVGRVTPDGRIEEWQSHNPVPEDVANQIRAAIPNETIAKMAMQIVEDTNLKDASDTLANWVYDPSTDKLVIGYDYHAKLIKRNIRPYHDTPDDREYGELMAGQARFFADGKMQTTVFYPEDNGDIAPNYIRNALQLFYDTQRASKTTSVIKIAGHIRYVETPRDNYGGNNGPNSFTFVYDPDTNELFVNTTEGSSHRNLIRTVRQEDIGLEDNSVGGWILTGPNKYIDPEVDNKYTIFNYGDYREPDKSDLLEAWDHVNALPHDLDAWTDSAYGDPEYKTYDDGQPLSKVATTFVGDQEQAKQWGGRWIYDPQTDRFVTDLNIHSALLRDYFGDQPGRRREFVYGWYSRPGSGKPISVESDYFTSLATPEEKVKAEALAYQFIGQTKTAATIGQAFIYDPLTKQMYIGAFHGKILRENPELANRFKSERDNRYDLFDFTTPMVLGWFNPGGPTLISDYGTSKATIQQKNEALNAARRLFNGKTSAVDLAMPGTPDDMFAFIYDPEKDVLFGQSGGRHRDLGPLFKRNFGNASPDTFFGWANDGRVYVHGLEPLPEDVQDRVRALANPSKTAHVFDGNETQLINRIEQSPVKEEILKYLAGRPPSQYSGYEFYNYIRTTHPELLEGLDAIKIDYFEIAQHFEEETMKGWSLMNVHDPSYEPPEWDESTGWSKEDWDNFHEKPEPPEFYDDMHRKIEVGDTVAYILLDDRNATNFGPAIVTDITNNIMTVVFLNDKERKPQRFNHIEAPAHFHIMSESDAPGNMTLPESWGKTAGVVMVDPPRDGYGGENADDTYTMVYFPTSETLYVSDKPNVSHRSLLREIKRGGYEGEISEDGVDVGVHCGWGWIYYTGMFKPEAAIAPVGSEFIPQDLMDEACRMIANPGKTARVEWDDIEDGYSPFCPQCDSKLTTRFKETSGWTGACWNCDVAFGLPLAKDRKTASTITMGGSLTPTIESTHRQMQPLSVRHIPPNAPLNTRALLSTGVQSDIALAQIVSGVKDYDGRLAWVYDDGQVWLGVTHSWIINHKPVPNPSRAAYGEINDGDVVLLDNGTGQQDSDVLAQVDRLLNSYVPRTIDPHQTLPFRVPPVDSGTHVSKSHKFSDFSLNFALALPTVVDPQGTAYVLEDPSAYHGDLYKILKAQGYDKETLKEWSWGYLHEDEQGHKEFDEGSDLFGLRFAPEIVKVVKVGSSPNSPAKPPSIDNIQHVPLTHSPYTEQYSAWIFDYKTNTLWFGDTGTGHNDLIRAMRETGAIRNFDWQDSSDLNGGFSAGSYSDLTGETDCYGGIDVPQHFLDEVRTAIESHMGGSKIGASAENPDITVVEPDTVTYGHDALLYNPMEDHLYICPDGHHRAIWKEFPYLKKVLFHCGLYEVNYEQSSFGAVPDQLGTNPATKAFLGRANELWQEWNEEQRGHMESHIAYSDAMLEGWKVYLLESNTETDNDFGPWGDGRRPIWYTLKDRIVCIGPQNQHHRDLRRLMKKANLWGTDDFNWSWAMLRENGTVGGGIDAPLDYLTKIVNEIPTTTIPDSTDTSELSSLSSDVPPEMDTVHPFQTVEVPTDRTHSFGDQPFIYYKPINTLWYVTPSGFHRAIFRYVKDHDPELLGEITSIAAYANIINGEYVPDEDGGKIWWYNATGNVVKDEVVQADFPEAYNWAMNRWGDQLRVEAGIEFIPGSTLGSNAFAYLPGGTLLKGGNHREIIKYFKTRGIDPNTAVYGWLMENWEGQAKDRYYIDSYDHNQFQNRSLIEEAQQFLKNEGYVQWRAPFEVTDEVGGNKTASVVREVESPTGPYFLPGHDAIIYDSTNGDLYVCRDGGHRTIFKHFPELLDRTDELGLYELRRYQGQANSLSLAQNTPVGEKYKQLAYDEYMNWIVNQRTAAIAPAKVQWLGQPSKSAIWVWHIPTNTLYFANMFETYHRTIMRELEPETRIKDSADIFILGEVDMVGNDAEVSDRQGFSGTFPPEVENAVHKAYLDSTQGTLHPGYPDLTSKTAQGQYNSWFHSWIYLVREGRLLISTEKNSNHRELFDEYGISLRDISADQGAYVPGQLWMDESTKEGHIEIYSDEIDEAEQWSEEAEAVGDIDEAFTFEWPDFFTNRVTRAIEALKEWFQDNYPGWELKDPYNEVLIPKTAAVYFLDNNADDLGAPDVTPQQAFIYRDGDIYVSNGWMTHPNMLRQLGLKARDLEDANTAAGWVDTSKGYVKIHSWEEAHLNKTNPALQQEVLNAVEQVFPGMKFVSPTQYHQGKTSMYFQYVPELEAESRWGGLPFVITHEGKLYVSNDPEEHHRDLMRQMGGSARDIKTAGVIYPNGEYTILHGDFSDVEEELSELPDDVWDYGYNMERTSAVPPEDDWYGSWFYFPDTDELFANRPVHWEKSEGDHRTLAKDYDLKDRLKSEPFVAGWYTKGYDHQQGFDIEPWGSDWLNNQTGHSDVIDPNFRDDQSAVPRVTELSKEKFPGIQFNSAAKLAIAS